MILDNLFVKYLVIVKQRGKKDKIIDNVQEKDPRMSNESEALKA